MRKVIVVMAIGEKYRRLFDKQYVMLEKYAGRCGAALKLIEHAPDPLFKRPLLAQKLLIPREVMQFDVALFLDLDIIIHPSAPSIFDLLSEEKSFAAVLEPRGSSEYKKAWSHTTHHGDETVSEYFEKRNFLYDNNLSGSINGGVFLFRPAVVESVFSEYYYSDHQQGAWESFEEAPMAYLTQTRNWFQSLDARFNSQLLYKIRGTEEGLKLYKRERLIPKFLRSWYYKTHNCAFYPLRGYRTLVEQYLDETYFLHFAGGFPM